MLALAVLWATPVQAAQAPSKKAVAAAKVAFGKGKKDFEAGRYKEAIVQYEKAYALSSMPAILFNIGQCHKKLGNWEQSVTYFQRFLEKAPKPVPNEALVNTLLAESRAKLAETVPQKPAGERADPAKLATAPETPTAAGDKPAAATPVPSSAQPVADPTVRPLVATAPLPPPEKPREDVAPAEAVAAAPVEALREEGESGVASKWWFWTAIGAVVVAGGVTAGVLATQPAPPLSQTSLGEIHF